jgi:16S rRNA (cytidine1402-2'-O)-methyltransferase
MLYVVPTPIGNLEDMTIRALRVLREADFILAEDTRTTKKLLDHFEIDRPLRSYHIHNEHNLVKNLVSQIQSGANVALVSDAGTPAISDPGFLLVRACVREGVEVSCLPGATAFVPALVASGLPADSFHFEGFLPHKKGRQTRLKHLALLENTFVLYESPHRLLRCLEELKEHCGDQRMACVARELSKKFESVMTKNLDELFKFYTENENLVRGEIVIVVEGLDEVTVKAMRKAEKR